MRSWKLINKKTGQRARLIHQGTKFWFSDYRGDEEIGTKQRSVRRFLKRKGYVVDNGRDMQNVAVRNVTSQEVV